MSRVIIPGVGFKFPDMSPGTRGAGAGPSFSGFALDAANENIGWVLRAPKTGNIAKIHFEVTSVTTGATVEVTIEGVNSSNGQPDGTPLTNGSTTVSVSAAGRHEAVFSPACAVTRGQRIAIKVNNPSASPGNFVVTLGDASQTRPTFPYSWTHLGGTFAKTTSSGNYLIEYDDGSYGIVPCTWGCADSLIEQDVIDGAGGGLLEEVGNIIRVPFKCVAKGWWLKAVYDDNATGVELRFYDADGSSPTLRRSWSHNEAHVGSVLGGAFRVPFDADFPLQPNVDYRVTVKGGTTANVGVAGISYFLAAHLATLSGGTVCHRTQREFSEDPFTQVDTQRMEMGLLISEIDDGVRAGRRLGSRIRPAAFKPGIAL